ncbi:UDP-3-O-acyl-N-acetylglucosamine deacetylase [cyanobiont of Ornithocercus magnificus]|nr:UDP-3-O-acyl-N-acetylglucosamine deacetylase [cyanobiont of Ornithocercus magnificus]
MGLLWPLDYNKAWTLGEVTELRGIGLHCGEEAFVRLHPSHTAGVQIRWSDGGPAAPVALDKVRESRLCTTLELDGRRLATVEHLLGAIAGCGLTHIELEVSGPEVPLLDGSAQVWVDAIARAGLVPAATAPRPAPRLQKPLVCQRGHSVITATPAQSLTLVGIIDFPQTAIGQQILTIELTPERFVNEIAPARTFGFSDQVEQLRQAGLIRGGNLDNALVCNGDSWLNPPLRFADEPVRHKLLDLLGDLALVGLPFPIAQILVYRGSHGLHIDLASALLNLYPRLSP